MTAFQVCGERGRTTVKFSFSLLMHLSMLSRWGGGGGAKAGDLT